MSQDAYAKRMGEVYSWATRYVAEDDSEYPFGCFFMTPPVASLLSRIVCGSKGLFFLVGHQGTGKTRTLMSLSSRLRSWDLKGLYIRWSSRPTKDD
jgi:type II secretory ATPase GspE/PulE/Tfp pilus assembly ATPase PilB-like protein